MNILATDIGGTCPRALPDHRAGGRRQRQPAAAPER